MSFTDYNVHDYRTKAKGAYLSVNVKLRIILISWTCLFFIGSTFARVEYNSEEYLKNYALSTCLAQGYQADEVKKDASAAARGYLEFGDYSLEAHTAVEKLAKTFLEKKYGGQAGVPMTMAKCIDFYHSKELSDLIKKYKGKQDN